MSEKLYLIDGNSYIWRAYHGCPNTLRTAAGLPTGAVFGFASIMAKLMYQHRPDYVIVVFDAGRHTFRNEIYPPYKTNRSAVPDDLAAQFPYFRKLIQAYNVPMIEMAGYEADDIIATLCEMVFGLDVVVVSGDKDLMQLVRPGVQLYDSGKGQWIREDDVKAKFGVSPDLVIEVLGLVGDAVDNIPGVSGIGQKGAMKLVQQFGLLETLYGRLEQITGRGADRTRHLLQIGKEDAFLSRQLATVKRDVPIDALPIRPFGGLDTPEAFALFNELEIPTGGWFR